MSRQRGSDVSLSLSHRASGRSTTNGGTSKRRGSGHGLSQTRRPARVASPEPEEEEEIPENDDEEVDASFAGEDGAANGNRKALAKEDLNRLVRNFVRYALACEFTRIPIRRDEISKRVLEGKYSRAFNQVFAHTQARLQAVFRMSLVELPAKEKHQTIQQQRRSAQNKSGPTMKSWVLMTTLPAEIRVLPDLLDGADEKDATYQGFVTTIVSLICLNAGVLQEESLGRYLRYLSIEEVTPLMTTEKLLTLMAKQGYIEKVKDMATGEPRFDYHLGPRGKIEVGQKGTMEFISRIYGDDMTEDLEKRIQRSMADLNQETSGVTPDDDEGPPRKRARRGDDDEDRPGASRSQRQEPEEPRRVESSSSRGRTSRGRQPEPEEEEEEKAEEVDEEEEEVEEEEAPRSRRSNSKAPARGNWRGRGRGRGGVRGRR